MVSVPAISRVGRIYDAIDHPLLFLVAVVGAGLLAAAYVAELLYLNDTAGFFAMYAGVAFFISVLGYVSVFLVKNVARILENRQIGAA